MIKYSILFFILLGLIPSAFAGVDTDAICADDTIYGRIDRNISVNYPGEKVDVDTIWKGYYANNPQDYFEKPSPRLYYIVNVRGKDTFYTRSELYLYDCKLKQPKKLFSVSINPKVEDYYAIDYLRGDNLIIVGRHSGQMDGETETVIVYDTRVNRKIFTIKNTLQIIAEGKIHGFVSSKLAWYLYVDLNYSDRSVLYKISKNTFKITEL